MAQVAAKAAIPEHTFVTRDTFWSASTDMGDLSCIMPVVHPCAGGEVGKAHGNDYYIADPVAACVDSAKLQVEMLYILLSNGAERAKEVIENYEPQFKSKDEYFAFVDKLSCAGDRIEYLDDGVARVKLT